MRTQSGLPKCGKGIICMLLAIGFFGCVLWSSGQTKAGKPLEISPSAAEECDRAVADGMRLFYGANSSLEARKLSSKTMPISDAEKELLRRREAVNRRIGEACFVSNLPGGDPVHSLMAESHWQLAQERYALQIEYLIESTALDISQDELAKANLYESNP